MLTVLRRGWPRWGALLTSASLTLVLLLLPSVVGSGAYLLVQLTTVLILGVVAISANVAWGYTGIFTFGQALFFGVGGYAAALLATKSHQSSLLPLLAIGAAAGAATGIVLAGFLFAGRRVGPVYVGLVTLALSYVAQQVATGWDRIGAANGIPNLPLPQFGSSTIGVGEPFYMCAVVLLAVVLLVQFLLTRSQFGLVMTAVRDDEERAEFFGYRRTVVQSLVFALSAAMAGIAGAFYGLFEGFIGPSLLGVALSTQIMLAVVLGGRGTLLGPLVGIGILQLGANELQARYPSAWPIALGFILLLAVLYLPQGLLGSSARVRDFARALRGRRKVTA